MKKILILTIFSMALAVFLISFINAQICDSEIVPIKQGLAINLTDVCDNCTYVNVTKVVYPNQTFSLLGQYNMTQNGTNYYLSYSQTRALGKYYYTTCGNLNGILTCQNICFDVTSSGKSGTANIVFFILIILLAYALNLIGFFKGNEILTALTGMFLMFLGVYMINQGIIVFRDDLTRYFSYITIGWGFASTIIALYSWIQDL